MCYWNHSTFYFLPLLVTIVCWIVWLIINWIFVNITDLYKFIDDKRHTRESNGKSSYLSWSEESCRHNLDRRAKVHQFSNSWCVYHCCTMPRNTYFPQTIRVFLHWLLTRSTCITILGKYQAHVSLELRHK